MIARLRYCWTRLFGSRSEPVPPGFVKVRPHTRRKPVNHKQVALHEQLRAEIAGRAAK